MAQKLILYTRKQELKQQSIIQKCYSLAFGQEEQKDYLILPEELIVDKLTDFAEEFKVAKRITTEMEQIDDTYGKFPFLLVGPHFINSAQISNYIRATTDIDEDLKKQDKETQITHRELEFLLQYKLHLVTMINYQKQDKDSRSNTLYNFTHPFAAFQGYFERQAFQNTCSGLLSMHSEVQRFDLAREIHLKLSQFLGNKQFFSSEEEGEEEEKQDIDTTMNSQRAKEVKLSMLDLLSYAYITEEITNTANSKEVEYLKNNFPNLIQHALRVKRTFPQNKNIFFNSDKKFQKEKVTSMFLQSDGTFFSERIHEVQTEKQLNESMVQRLYILGAAALVFSYLNFKENPLSIN